MGLDTLKALLTFDPETGTFRWAATRGRALAGDIAGYADANGDLVVTVAGLGCYARDLAWLWSRGEWPARHLRHINGDRSDCRPGNLALEEP